MQFIFPANYSNEVSNAAMLHSSLQALAEIVFAFKIKSKYHNNSNFKKCLHQKLLIHDHYVTNIMDWSSTAFFHTWKLFLL